MKEKDNAAYKTRSEMLGKEKIGRLLVRLSTPAIIGMMVQALYNLVDAVFVGRGVGTLGIGGITISFPPKNAFISSLRPPLGFITAATDGFFLRDR